MAKSEKEKRRHDGMQKKKKDTRNGEEHNRDQEKRKHALEISLLADEKAVDPALSSLFAPKVCFQVSGVCFDILLI
jgi:hypothetical protein